MKLPKHIKDAIRKAGKYNQLSKEKTDIVRDWLEMNALEELYWEDVLIDSLESGVDESEFFITYLETGGKIIG